MPISRAPATRLHAEAPLAPGGTVMLEAEAAHRLKAVLRLRPGDAVALFNARDGEYLARIAAFAREGVSLAIEERRIAPHAEGDLWLVFAVIKRPRLELLVEKATELGASALLPVTTERTQPQALNLPRLRLIAREAAEQSERLGLPDVFPPRPLPALLAEWPRDRRLVVCDETGTAPAAAVLTGIEPGPLALLVGPEGGFAERELDGFGKLPFVFRIGLGPRVLRSETAALAGLSVLQALAGDWREARRQERA